MRETSYRTSDSLSSDNTLNKGLTSPFTQDNPLKLSVIIPCYNEESTITLVLDKIAGVALIGGIRKEIIIVNDCSTDQTEPVIQEYICHHPEQDIQYLKHPLNQGKGAALQTGIGNATGNFLIIQDADLEYDPADYNALLIPILKGHADIVYGSRFIGGSPHRILFFWHTIGNRLLTFLSNMLTNLNLTDMETGYKLFRTSIIQQIPLKEKRFGFEPEITVKISRIPSIRIYEVGISYFGRTYKEGKKIRMKDAFRCLHCLIKYRMAPGKMANIGLQQQNVSLVAQRYSA